MKNPDTIEISGYATINKLCKFAADRGHSGITFTRIVDLMFTELEAPTERVSVPKTLSSELALKLAEADFRDISPMSRYEHRGLTSEQMEGMQSRWIQEKAIKYQILYQTLISVTDSQHKPIEGARIHAESPFFREHGRMKGHPLPTSEELARGYYDL